MSIVEPHLHVPSVLPGRKGFPGSWIGGDAGSAAKEHAAFASLLRRCCGRHCTKSARERLNRALRVALASQTSVDSVRCAVERPLALALLVVLSPLLLLLGVIAAVSSRGSPLYHQPRHGLGGRPFLIYKFRTMYNAHSDADGRRQATTGDVRVTRAGRVMRRWSLDEIPQLLNVVRGEMSFVGPRPHPIGMMAGGVAYESLVGTYDLRCLVRPGITGLAQLRGLRGPTTDAARARMRIVCDLAYIANRSLLSDLTIVLMTVAHELCRARGT